MSLSEPTGYLYAKKAFRENADECKDSEKQNTAGEETN